MIDLVCPRCGTETSFAAVGRDADSFCPVCDFPIFFSEQVVASRQSGTETDVDYHNRLPGAGGRHRLSTVVCPNCEEVNPSTRELCLRCRHELHPAPPVPEPAPEPEPVVEEVVPEPAVGFNWAPFLWTAGIAILAFIVIVVLILATG